MGTHKSDKSGMGKGGMDKGEAGRKPERSQGSTRHATGGQSRSSQDSPGRGGASHGREAPPRSSRDH